MELEVGALSDRGRVRAANEDSFLVAQVSAEMQAAGTSSGSFNKTPAKNAGGCQVCNTTPRDSVWLLAVADGMGGHDNGTVASQLVTSHFARFAKEEPEMILAACRRPAMMRRLMTKELRKCHQRMKDESGLRRELRKMGSTATIAVIAWPKLFVAHIGDSRCCILSQGRLRQLTRDHTMAQYLLDRGSLLPSQAAESLYNHLLYNSLGAEHSQVDVEFRSAVLKQDDSVLVCSDGLTNPLNDLQLATVIKESSNADDACRKLVEIANHAGGQDNITCVLASPLPTSKAAPNHGLRGLLQRVMAHAASFI